MCGGSLIQTKTDDGDFQEKDDTMKAVYWIQHICDSGQEKDEHYKSEQYGVIR